MLDEIASLARIDLAPRHRQPLADRVLLATVAAIGGSLVVNAILVAVGQAVGCGSCPGRDQGRRTKNCATGRCADFRVLRASTQGRQAPCLRANQAVILPVRNLRVMQGVTAGAGSALREAAAFGRQRGGNRTCGPRSSGRVAGWAEWTPGPAGRRAAAGLACVQPAVVGVGAGEVAAREVGPAGAAGAGLACASSAVVTGPAELPFSQADQDCCQ
jgi:hypothetical protein